MENEDFFDFQTRDLSHVTTGKTETKILGRGKSC